MKCIECKFYFSSQGDAEAGCADGGDVSNPEEDFYCAAVDGFDGDMDAWEKEKAI